jgi:hypothetical protein
MGGQRSTLAIAARPAVDDVGGSRRDSAAGDVFAALVLRFGGEFREMPGLRLTPQQAARLFGVQAEVALAVLDELERLSVLARSSDGRYASSADADHGTRFESTRLDR